MRVKILFSLLIFILLYSCGTSESLPVSKFYNYDRELPLQDSVKLIEDKNGLKVYDVSYRSVHYKKVTGLLSIPSDAKKPLPVIILLHGVGDKKTVDYLEFGNAFYLKHGYAVFRIDLSDHGDRIENDHEFDLTGETRYWTRNVISQSVFDLRRGIDFLATRQEIDQTRIGFFGISLGGITGTVFAGVDKRVKVPVIAIAGGQLNLLYGKKALGSNAKDFVSIIEPLNFVEQISPRPLLMINAENDEIVPPMMSKLLYKKAEKPKNIIWYPSEHRNIPIEKVYQDGLNWYKKYLN